MKYYNLCDVCDFQGGTQPPKEEWSFDLKDGYIRMLQIRDFTQRERTVPEYIKLTNTTKTCCEDDILIARYGASLGKILTGLAGAYNVAIMKTIPNTEVLDKKYLYYYLKSPVFQRFLLNVGSRAAQAGFNKNDLKELLIPNITKEKQKEKVDVLEKIEKIISSRKQQLEKLDQLVKSRFVEMFGDVESKVPISYLCNVSGGYSFKSSDITNDGDIRILQIGNVYLDNVNWVTVNYLPKGYDEIHSRFLLNKGDIVIALTRPIIQSMGNVKACIVQECDLPCLLNQRVGRISSKVDKNVSLEFIYGCLMTDEFTRYVESCCVGCSQPNISTKDIDSYLIPVVSFEEQMKYVYFKEQVDKSKVAVQKALDEAQTLFDSLMQEYFG